MAELQFCDKHNMIAILEKIDDNTDFHQILNFLNKSYIKYALTASTVVYTSVITQFWSTTALEIDEEGYQVITATIDKKVKVRVSEASVRRHLKFGEEAGISALGDEEIFAELARMGYVTESRSLTFKKANFSPQWRFLIHNLLHCLSPKKTAWEQFSSNIATALICLATRRTFNFAKLIFDAIVKNIHMVRN